MRFWIPFLILCDVLAIVSAWAFAYWLRFRAGWLVISQIVSEANAIHPAEIYQVPVLLSLLLYYWVLNWQGAYRFPQPSWDQEMRALLRGMVVASPLLVTLVYLLYRDKYSRLVLAFFLVFSLLLAAIGRWVLRFCLMRWFSRQGHSRCLVAICAREERSAKILSEYMALRPDARLVRQVNFDDLDDFSIAADRPDEVLIIFPQLNAPPLERILQDLESELVDIKFIPDWGGFRLLGYDIEQAGRLPVIHLRRSPLHGWGLIGKRAMDVTVALAAIVLTLPLTGLIALLVWMTSGRPVIYSQERMGFDGRLFKIYKFRSMVVDADRKPTTPWTQRDDPRRTRVGAWLRRSSLDELPQLYNILRGDMSLVGPRPEIAHLVGEFKKHIPHYYLRHKVKAGLTGWAQIHGLRGNTSLEERINYDLYYIENWSLWLDVKILALTLVRAWSNAY